MISRLLLVLGTLTGMARSHASVAAENAVLRITVERWLFDDTTDAKHSTDSIDELAWPEGLLKEGPGQVALVPETQILRVA